MIKRIILLLAISLLSMQASAVMVGDILNINGFMTTGFTKSNEDQGVLLPNSLAISDQYRYTIDSRAGLQISAQINENVSGTIQLLADFQNNSQELEMQAEWAFIRYDITDSLAFKTGRMRLPSLQISEARTIGYSYLWVRPPLEIMDLLANDLIDCLSLSYSTVLGDGDYIFSTSAMIGSNPGVNGKVGGKNAMVTTFALENDIWKIRLAWGQGDVDLHTMSETDAANLNAITSGFSNPALSAFGYNEIADYFDVGDKTVQYLVLGFNMDWNDWLIYSEICQRTADKSIISDGLAYYITLGRRFGKWTPHITYSKTSPSNDVVDSINALPDIPGITSDDTLRAGALLLADDIYNDDQHTITLGVKYIPVPGYDIKFDIMRVTPDDGGVGLFKDSTTGYDGSSVTIYNVAFDMVF